MQAAVSRLIAAYERIGTERMAGLPFVNERLELEAVGFREWDGRFVGVLISPWFMNLMLLPTGREDWQSEAVGAMVEITLPAGSWQFTNCLLPGIGCHLSLPLFSGVGDFPDQATARGIATEIQRRLFDVPTASAKTIGKSERPISRRALFGAITEPASKRIPDPPS